MAVQRDVTDRRSVETELKEADRKKDEFLATLAHELRNPLSPIRSGIQLLSKKNVSSMQAQTLAIMGKQVSHLVNLVNDLLDVSRITRGNIELKLESLNFVEIVRSVVDAAGTSAENQKRINVNLPNVSVLVSGDTTRLSQIVSNLLGNALKYSDPGTPVLVQLMSDGTFALLKITDAGVGINPDMLNSIFTMFTQAKDVLHRSQGGLGLGLTIVKKLIEMHGGAVWAESLGEGQGSTFYIKIPVEQVGSEVTQSLDTVDLPPSRAKILIADDNRDAADMMRVYLQSEAFDCTCCYDGKSALSIVDTLRPDFVLLDIGMPGINGYEVAREIRSRNQLPNTKLYAVTGFGDQAAIQEVKAAGFDKHFVKPTDLEVIVQALLADIAGVGEQTIKP